MDSLSVCGSIETVDTLRLLRMLRPVKAKLASFSIFKPAVIIIRENSNDNIRELTEKCTYTTLNNTSFVKKRSNSNGSSGSTIATYGRQSRGNNCSNNNGIGNYAQINSQRSIAPQSIAELQHIHANSIRLRDQRTEWSCTEPFAPWDNIPSKELTLNNNQNGTDRSFKSSHIILLSILSAFSIGEYLSRLEFMVKDTDEQEMCNQYAIFLPQFLDPLIIVCLSYRLDIQAFSFIKSRITYNFPASREDMEQLYCLAAILKKENTFIDVIIATLTPLRACSATLVEFCQKLPLSSAYPLALVAITAILSDTTCWEHATTPYRLCVLLRLIATYSVNQEKSIIDSNIDDEQDSLLWRQDMISLTLLILDNNQPLLPREICMVPCLMAVKFDTTLADKVADFWRLQQTSLTTAAILINHSGLIFKIGAHFHQENHHLLAVNLYEQAIKVLEARRLILELISSEQYSTVLRSINGRASRRISWKNDDDFDFYIEPSSPMLVNNDVNMDFSDPLSSDLLYDSDFISDCEDDKENFTSTIQNLYSNQQSSTMKGENYVKVALSSNNSIYKRPRITK
ncbi:hypothetical protein BDF19DRAFT_438962 [Syncephalis fuscata]|nr:hypothetical protein BDF19DRAFT_438962 [Syncephalis fuscata]